MVEKVKPVSCSCEARWQLGAWVGLEIFRKVPAQAIQCCINVHSGLHTSKLLLILPPSIVQSEEKKVSVAMVSLR